MGTYLACTERGHDRLLLLDGHAELRQVGTVAATPAFPSMSDESSRTGPASERVNALDELDKNRGMMALLDEDDDVRVRVAAVRLERGDESLDLRRELVRSAGEYRRTVTSRRSRRCGLIEQEPRASGAEQAVRRNESFFEATGLLGIGRTGHVVQEEASKTSVGGNVGRSWTVRDELLLGARRMRFELGSVVARYLEDPCIEIRLKLAADEMVSNVRGRIAGKRTRQPSKVA